MFTDTTIITRKKIALESKGEWAEKFLFMIQIVLAAMFVMSFFLF